MKDKIFGVLQRVGRSFMLPIAILPVAGLLLGIGSSFTNETTIATYGLQNILESGTLLNSLLLIMNKVGSAVFDNLPLIFAVGVAIGMAKKEKEVAASFRTDRIFCYECGCQCDASYQTMRLLQMGRLQQMYWKEPLLLYAGFCLCRWVYLAVLS